VTTPDLGRVTCDHVGVTEFDCLADYYDQTRGGERRGDEYAADIDARLPPGEGPILEIGVGTGVVALGLRRRGREVIGLDLSAPMLIKARSRLGPAVVLSDALEMAIASASMAHAFSVWVVHSVADPVKLFHEAARVVRPGGRYVVCATQHPAPDDVIGTIVKEMGERIDVARCTVRPRGVGADEVLAWAQEAGFTGTLSQLHRRWYGTPADELSAIEYRTWPAMHQLDEDTLEEVTRPAVEALSALPETEHLRRATADVVVLNRR
jgi:ubiquinone/menaquinone biosynthesis C-methylase UbiE